MEWISVDDRLPDYDERVILNGTYSFTKGHVEKFVSERCRKQTDSSGEVYRQNMTCIGDVSVTHWMPLPEPPK